MDRIPLIIGGSLAIACLVYFSATAIGHLHALPPLRWGEAGTYFGFGAAIGGYLATIVLGACAWRLLLGDTTSSRSFSAIPVYLVSQFGKYLPGNVGHLVGRIALARRCGVGAWRVGGTLVLEGLLSALAGVAVAIAALPALAGVWRSAIDLRPDGEAIAVMSFIAVILFAAATLTPARGWAAAAGQRLKERLGPLPGPRALICAVLLYGSAHFVVGGILVFFLGQLVFDLDMPSTIIASGLFATASVAGFMMPGAPAGLGIREVILSVGFEPFVGYGAAVGLALALRAVSAAGDLLGFGSGLVAMRGGMLGAGSSDDGGM